MEQRELPYSTLAVVAAGQSCLRGLLLAVPLQRWDQGDGKVPMDPGGTGDVSVCCAISGSFHKVNKGLHLIH